MLGRRIGRESESFPASADRRSVGVDIDVARVEEREGPRQCRHLHDSVVVYDARRDSPHNQYHINKIQSWSILCHQITSIKTINSKRMVFIFSRL